MAKATPKPTYLEDYRHVRAVLKGDEAAFRRFFDDHYARLYRFALARLGNDRHAAEDVAQQTLSKALDKLDSYRAESQLMTWLCAICRNQVIDWQRKNGSYRDNVILIEDAPEIRAVIDSFHAPDIDRPEFAAERSDAIRLIQVALDRLPSRYGDVLEWKYIEGFTSQEIGARLEIGTEAVNSLVARAKRAFREVYSPLAQALTAHTHE